MNDSTVKVALAQISPVFLDLNATLAKAHDTINEAARNGADIVVFPETYIAAFPLWSALQAPIYNHDFFRRMVENSVFFEGLEMERLARVTRSAGIWVSMGFNERSVASGGGLWNSNVIFDRQGRCVNHRRKLVPTFYEKLTWSNGDASGLEVIDSDIGRLGMLICGENTNPLARYALIAEAEQLHVSSYPPVWPTRDPRGSGNYDLTEAIRIRAAAHSFEGKCFNAVVAGVLDSRTVTALTDSISGLGAMLEEFPRGASMLIDPTGTASVTAAPGEETLCYGEANLSNCLEPKQFHDISCGYNRFDVFHFSIDKARREPIYRADRHAAATEQSGHVAGQAAVTASVAGAAGEPENLSENSYLSAAE